MVNTRAISIVSVSLLPLCSAFTPQLDFTLDADGCVSSPYDASVDYFPLERRAIYTEGIQGDITEFAEDFQIQYMRTKKIVRNLRTGMNYVLHHCGLPRITSDLPADAVAAAAFDVPVSKWSTASTIPISFAEELGLGPHLVHLDATYVVSPCVQKRQKCDAVGHGSPYAPGWSEAINASGSQLNIIDTFGTGATGTEIDVSFDASGDPGALARVEWVKFIAAFFNKEPEANRILESTEERFNAIAAQVRATRSTLPTLPPRVAFLTFLAGYGTTPSRWEIEQTEYLLDILSHAGARQLPIETFISACPTTSTAHSKFLCDSSEALKPVLEQLDIVIDLTYAPTPASYTLDTFLSTYNLTNDDASRYPFLTNSKVLRVDAATASLFPPIIGLDWFEDAIPHPDAVLADLVAYIVPEAIANKTNSRVPFTRNIALNEQPVVIDSSSCDSPFMTCPGETAPPTPPPEFNGCIGGTSYCVIAFPPSPPASPPSPASPPTSPSPSPSPLPPPSGDSDDDLPGWAVALIAVVSVLAVAALAFSIILVLRERSGSPLFTQQLVDVTSTAPKPGQVEATSSL
mmetsp:Transcript_7481/g.16494  ORF Transcript_7481/g.16494 Transcript_7481/m.16494 type:complete len:575 (+) Transcript_7481:208-1932(+)